eukprot:gene10657-12338_t
MGHTRSVARPDKPETQVHELDHQGASTTGGQGAWAWVAGTPGLAQLPDTREHTVCTTEHQSAKHDWEARSRGQGGQQRVVPGHDQMTKSTARSDEAPRRQHTEARDHGGEGSGTVAGSEATKGTKEHLGRESQDQGAQGGSAQLAGTNQGPRAQRVSSYASTKVASMNWRPGQGHGMSAPTCLVSYYQRGPGHRRGQRTRAQMSSKGLEARAEGGVHTCAVQLPMTRGTAWSATKQPECNMT